MELTILEEFILAYKGKEHGYSLAILQDWQVEFISWYTLTISIILFQFLLSHYLILINSAEITCRGIKKVWRLFWRVLTVKRKKWIELTSCEGYKYIFSWRIIGFLYNLLFIHFSLSTLHSLSYMKWRMYSWQGRTGAFFQLRANLWFLIILQSLK